MWIFQGLMSYLTHCGLMTPYGDRDVGLHWLRKWLVAWRHQAITWTNVDLPSVRSIGIHLSIISQEILQPSITKISWKIAFKFPTGFGKPGKIKFSGKSWNFEKSSKVMELRKSHTDKLSHSIRNLALISFASHLVSCIHSNTSDYE